MAIPKVVRGKSLLVASVGVAAISYACSSSSNGSSFPGGNTDASTDDVFISSGNLAGPVDSGQFVDTGVPDDAGLEDASKSDASDSGDAGTD